MPENHRGLFHPYLNAALTSSALLTAWITPTAGHVAHVAMCPTAIGQASVEAPHHTEVQGIQTCFDSSASNPYWPSKDLRWRICWPD